MEDNTKILNLIMENLESLRDQMTDVRKSVIQIETRMESRPSNSCIEYMDKHFVNRTEINAFIEKKQEVDDKKVIRKFDLISNLWKVVNIIALLYMLVFVVSEVDVKPLEKVKSVIAEERR